LAWVSLSATQIGPETLRQQRPALTKTKDKFAMAAPDYTDEIWKPIPYALNYAVSDHGRVKRLHGGKGARSNHILATSNWSPNRDYVCAHLVTNEGEVISRRMNRLVLEVFVGPPPTPRHMSLHGDGNSLNNHVNNLRWGTQKENRKDSERHGTAPYGSAYKRSGLTEQDVLDIRASTEFHRILAQRYRVSMTAISHIKTRTTWTHI